MARTCYRIVQSNPPTPQDCMSFKELGRQPRDRADPEVLRRWDKGSVWGNAEQARPSNRRSTERLVSPAAPRGRRGLAWHAIGG